MLATNLLAILSVTSWSMGVRIATHQWASNTVHLQSDAAIVRVGDETAKQTDGRVSCNAGGTHSNGAINKHA
jgi:hypothetical protein